MITPQEQEAHGCMLVPVIHGRNRLRGAGAGWMVDDDPSHGGVMDRLRRFIGSASSLADATDDERRARVTETIHLALGIHSKTAGQPLDGTIGPVTEIAIGDGRRLILADARILSRLSLKILEDIEEEVA
jgi:hypothetical protein